MSPGLSAPAAAAMERTVAVAAFFYFTRRVSFGELCGHSHPLMAHDEQPRG